MNKIRSGPGLTGMGILLFVVIGMFAATGHATSLSYKLDITTIYIDSAVPYGGPFGSPYFGVNGPFCDVNGFCAGPDSGFAVFHNAGTTDFIGTVKLNAWAMDGVGYVYNTFQDLLAGQTKLLEAHTYPEFYGWFGYNPAPVPWQDDSSNHGGFNPERPWLYTPGAPQLGLQMSFNGVITDGFTSQSVYLEIFDRDVHSGVFRTPITFPDPGPYLLSDSYVLQGGDPLGRNPTGGDEFEREQHSGSYTFEQMAQVPEPGSILLLSAGILGLAAVRRRAGNSRT